MTDHPDRFLHDAMRAGLVLGWLSVLAVLAVIVLGAHVEREELVLALTGTAAGANAVLGILPWRHWMHERRGQILLDAWATGLLAYVGLLVLAGGGRSGLDLLLFLVIPFLALVHAGVRRRLFLAGAAGTYLGAMVLAPDPLAPGLIVLHGVLLAAATVLALILERTVRREAAARAHESARADLECALLAESHHRVKNSLQTVADLLLLGRPSGAGGHAFDQTAGRIRAIASVHRLLADRRGRSVTAADLFESVSRAAAPGLAVGLDIDDVLLAPAQAQQLAVVANELIANAVDHGAPPIQVRFAATHLAELDVHNTGATDDRQTGGGLGLRLVRQVTEHGLMGTFALVGGPGGHAHARVVFPLDAHARIDS